MSIKRTLYNVRSGYDGTKCFVHARCCATPDFLLATAQFLDVSGSDLFSGIYSCKSIDGGKSWSEFSSEPGLAPLIDGDLITVGCDATPIYHKKSGDILLLGHTAEYKVCGTSPTGIHRNTFFSVYNREKERFEKIQFLEMPEGYACCGNGSGQSVELENGELLIPVYYRTPSSPVMSATVLRCAYSHGVMTLLEMGNALTMAIGRGLYEPSLICHNGVYYMTLRNDECGCVAQSNDGLHYTNLQHWKWQDGSLLDNYNTQQHWMTLGEELYLVYTRRGANNDHVFRHRAPLFVAKVDNNMRLVRESEFVAVDERGARLGNFGTVKMDEKRSAIMAAEWMQPRGCESYGSDNTIFFSVLENKDD